MTGCCDAGACACAAGAADCAGAADGCCWPCGGFAASFAAARTATPSTTVTRIFFISMAPWILGKFTISRNRIFYFGCIALRKLFALQIPLWECQVDFPERHARKANVRDARRPTLLFPVAGL